MASTNQKLREFTISSQGSTSDQLQVETKDRVYLTEEGKLILMRLCTENPDKLLIVLERCYSSLLHALVIHRRN